jgi:CheY-like chemotaxis protein
MARILIADDHQDFRDIWRMFLEHQGHYVLDAGDGEEAVRLSRLYHPDLVILDVFMPRKSGIEALREIRRDQLARKVVVLSAAWDWPASNHDLNLTVLDAAVALGADAVFGKPLDPYALLDTLATTLAA